MSNPSDIFRKILESRPEISAVLHCDETHADILINPCLIRDMYELNTPLKNPRSNYFKAVDYAISMLSGFMPNKQLECLLVTDQKMLAEMYFQSDILFALIGAHTRLRACLLKAAYLYLVSADKVGSPDPKLAFDKLYADYITGNDLDGLRALAAKCPDPTALRIKATVLFNKPDGWVSDNYAASNNQEPLSDLDKARCLIQTLRCSSAKTFEEEILAYSKRGYRTEAGIPLNSPKRVMELLRLGSSSPKLQAAFAGANPDQMSALHQIAGYISAKYPQRHLKWTVAMENATVETLQAIAKAQRLKEGEHYVCLKTAIPAEVLADNSPFGLSYSSGEAAVIITRNSQDEKATSEEEELLALLTKSPVTFAKEMNKRIAAKENVISTVEDEEPQEKTAPPPKAEKKTFKADATPTKSAALPAATKTTKADQPSPAKLGAAFISNMRSPGAGVKSTPVEKPPEKKEPLAPFHAIAQYFFLLQEWEAMTGCSIGLNTRCNAEGQLEKIGPDDMAYLVAGRDPLAVLEGIDGIGDINYPFPLSSDGSGDAEKTYVLNEMSALCARYTGLAIMGELVGEVTGKPFSDNPEEFVPDLSVLHTPAFRNRAAAAVEEKVRKLNVRRKNAGK